MAFLLGRCGSFKQGTAAVKGEEKLTATPASGRAPEFTAGISIAPSALDSLQTVDSTGPVPQWLIKFNAFAEVAEDKAEKLQAITAMVPPNLIEKLDLIPAVGNVVENLLGSAWEIGQSLPWAGVIFKVMDSIHKGVKEVRLNKANFAKLQSVIAQIRDVLKEPEMSKSLQGLPQSADSALQSLVQSLVDAHAFMVKFQGQGTIMYFLSLSGGTQRFQDLSDGIKEAYEALRAMLDLHTHTLLKNLHVPDYKEDLEEIKALQRQLLDDFHSAWGMAKLRFELSATCQLVLQQGDISMWFLDRDTDAIVNPTNQAMKPGGVACNGVIHAGAGKELWRYIENNIPVRKEHMLRYECCDVEARSEQPAPVKAPCPSCDKVAERRGKLQEVRLGFLQACTTEGFGLFARRIVHTVGNAFNGMRRDEAVSRMRTVYENCLKEANKGGLIRYLAFPALSCGTIGLPPKYAAEVAIEACKKEAGNLKEIHFVLQDKRAWVAWSTVAANYKPGTDSGDAFGGAIQVNNFGNLATNHKPGTHSTDVDPFEGTIHAKKFDNLP
ncbi:hypothetical protein KFL_003760080 [Klebsormidium nitens]|uniref:Macro domain-containing protein n=1 Tax=Klebsormidium nitens TaxID=105231 RepID=A0A1Y1I9Y5_KLENI|nr:hypothetical protein KFL_003760080 [Klebsormidium nitens]|eukprot:GAQ87775.1 hypothetical protein KFL_003760080 [Klebsormidium nitens]